MVGSFKSGLKRLLFIFRFITVTLCLLNLVSANANVIQTAVNSIFGGYFVTQINTHLLLRTVYVGLTQDKQQQPWKKDVWKERVQRSELQYFY